jgi:hypothetical protein
MTVVWRNFFVLWNNRNEAIHGHDMKSQQIAWKQKLHLKIGFLHNNRNQVLACDSDLFLANTTEALNTILDVTSASQTHNWLNIWKPIILSSIASAKYLSICWVQLSYPGSVNITPRPPNQQAHQKARPKQPDRRPLPTPSFLFRSLRSFFGLASRPS